jgi:hypothetical protein
MYLCYLDESGVPEIPGNSTHFVLAGIAIPIERWREADAAISEIMARYGLAGAELHTAWLLRKYIEQSKIQDFDSLGWDERRNQVARLRVAEVHRVRKLGIAKRNSQLKKVYRHTDPYTHLTFQERSRLTVEIAEAIAKWDWAILIASCIDKAFFLTKHGPDQVNTVAFSRVLVQFTQFLEEAESFGSIEAEDAQSQISAREFGLLIHDNNETVALKHTRHLRAIQTQDKTAPGGLFQRIIETPLFVDSSLTCMIQLADLWAYSLRRYVENGETLLFSSLFSKKWTAIGGSRFPIPRASVHHFAELSCECSICAKSGTLEQ